MHGGLDETRPHRNPNQKCAQHAQVDEEQPLGLASGAPASVGNKPRQLDSGAIKQPETPVPMNNRARNSPLKALDKANATRPRTATLCITRCTRRGP